MGTTIMDELYLAAVAGAALLGAVAGPIGLLRPVARMAYLALSIAEMALLGAALGLLLRIDPLWGVLATSLTAGAIAARPWSASLASRQTASSLPTPRSA